MHKSATAWLWITLLFPALATGGSSYATWSLAIPEEHRAFSADPDGDFRPNGLEFVLIPSPLASDSPHSILLSQTESAAGPFATVTFDLADATFEDVTLTLEATMDAASWEPIASLSASATLWTGPALVATQPLPASPGVRVSVRDSIPLAPGQQRFFRLTASRQILDHDGDGMTDVYEAANDLDPNLNDSALDRDGDGLSNLEEFELGLRANRRDSDLDGWHDGFEQTIGSSPSQAGQLFPVSHPATQLIINLPMR